jgi:hypothetical protein
MPPPKKGEKEKDWSEESSAALGDNTIKFFEQALCGIKTEGLQLGRLYAASNPCGLFC